MDRLTAQLTSKAAKVRALYGAGVTTADIGRYLTIRYQHVYNVLLRAGLIEKAGAAPSISTKDVAADIIVTNVGNDGKIELSADIMERYGLRAGGAIYCRALPESLMLLSHDAAMAYVTQIAREKMPEQAALIEALLNRKPGTPPGST